MYECHITIKKPSKDIIKLEVLAKTHKWKTSYIDGDPLLGKKIYFYFTCHHEGYGKIFSKMNHLSGILEADGIKVLRKKIELIVFDTKKQLIGETT